MRSEETNRRKTATTRRNRLARRARMTPEERAAAMAWEFAWRSKAASKGWRTRRARAGTGPGAAEATRPERLYTADLRELARLLPGVGVKDAVRAAVEALRVAKADGVWV